MHSHTWTCYKGGHQLCRFGFPLNLYPKTEIDGETEVLRIKRNHAWVNGFNRAAALALRCNTDCKMVMSSTECHGTYGIIGTLSRDVDYNIISVLLCSGVVAYVTDYLTKHGLSMTSLLPIIKEAVCATKPAIDTFDRTRRLVIKCLTKMLSHTEIPAPYAFVFLLGLPVKYTSHTVTYVPYGSAVIKLEKAKHSVDKRFESEEVLGTVEMATTSDKHPEFDVEDSDCAEDCSQGTC